MRACVVNGGKNGRTGVRNYEISAVAVPRQQLHCHLLYRVPVIYEQRISQYQSQSTLEKTPA